MTTQTLTPSDLIPTVGVAAITAVANAAGWRTISIPGAVLTAVMIVVTLHPRWTIRSLRRHADRGSATNIAITLAILAAGVGALLPIAPRSCRTALFLTWLASIVIVFARAHGTCRACGWPGSARAPLTLLRRPRVHVRHLPDIRASIRASRTHVIPAIRRDSHGGTR